MTPSLACGLPLASTVWFDLWPTCAWSADEIPFVEIRAAGDSFIMGDEMLGPRAPQAISYDYSISKFPITDSQFRMFIEDCGYSDRSYWTGNGWKWKGNKSQPAFWTESRFNGPDQPVVGVSWYEAVAFCNWLCLKEGHRQTYDGSGRANLSAPGYRLPTETEWEYAAAKGSPDEAERVFPWGDAWDPKNAVCSVAPARAPNTAEVGSRSPYGDTPQGLADISGNVWQWCSDNAQRLQEWISRSLPQFQHLSWQQVRCDGVSNCAALALKEMDMRGKPASQVPAGWRGWIS